MCNAFPALWFWRCKSSIDYAGAIQAHSTNSRSMIAAPAVSHNALMRHIVRGCKNWFSLWRLYHGSRAYPKVLRVTMKICSCMCTLPSNLRLIFWLYGQKNFLIFRQNYCTFKLQLVNSTFFGTCYTKNIIPARDSLFTTRLNFNFCFEKFGTNWIITPKPEKSSIEVGLFILNHQSIKSFQNRSIFSS